MNKRDQMTQLYVGPAGERTQILTNRRPSYIPLNSILIRQLETSFKYVYDNKIIESIWYF